MKRLVSTLLLAVVLISPSVATPAQAATIGVSATARVRTFTSTNRVDFTVKTSKQAKARIRVYYGAKLVRTLNSATSGTSLVVPWDCKSSSGTRVRAATYTYIVNATSWAGTGVCRGRVAVPKPPVKIARFFGAYVHGAPDSLAPVQDLESRIAARVTRVNFYVADSESFPVNRATAVRDHGSIPLITWEFWSLKDVGVSAISNGSKDAYLRSFARASKAFGSEIWLRPFHEMNGDWYPWCGTVAPNTPAQVVAAFRHVRNIFAEEGATNVKFVWCPNNDSTPNTSANAIAKYWPGDAYVHYIALDGYNFGDSYSWSNWRTFSATFKSSYAAVSKLSSTKPIFIAETACSPVGGKKSAWVADMFRVIPASFPRLKGVVWFETNAECDWRICADSATLSSFKAGLATF